MVLLVAINGLSRGWRVMGQDQTAQLHALYIDSNPNKDGDRAALDWAGDDSTYSTVHAQVNPEFRAIRTLYGYQDVYLLDSSRNIVYSVGKQDDFARNIADPKLKGSGLAQVHAQAMGAIRLCRLQRLSPAERRVGGIPGVAGV